MTEKKQLFFGGEVYTVDEARPRAEAVAIQGETIVAVGSVAECKAKLGPDHESVNLRGARVLPGFIDTHLHPIPMIFFDHNIDLGGITTIEELKDIIRAMAQSRSPKEWVIGLQFDEEVLKDRRLPTRHDLDAACPDRPAIIIKHDGHMVIANTQAIRAMGVTASTPDPMGGQIDREPGGFPLGFFRENATNLALGAMPMPDIEGMKASARTTFGKLAAHGITSIGGVFQTYEEGPSGPAGAFEVLGMIFLLEHLPINLYSLLIAREIEKMTAARNSPLHQEKPGVRRVGAIKIFSDGAFGACTASMREPYTDYPDRKGLLSRSPDEIYRIMTEAHQAGIPIAIHAVGDAANRLCIDLYDRLLKESPRPDHRYRLEHASLLDAGMIADIARLGLVVSTQPLFIHSEKHWLHKRLGPERAQWTYPFRSLLAAGIRVAGASDAPVESVNVLHAIQCCVTREGFETQQGITVEQAIRMFTLDAAYAQFEDQIKGSLSPGKRADMVVLSQDPTAVPPEKIREIVVQQTICGGKLVYERARSQP